MKKTDISFMAALIEGEGCIHISQHKVKGRGIVGYILGISIKNTALSLLKFCRNKFGGTVRLRKSSKTGRYKTYHWRIYGPKASKILVSIYPYLISKRKQANLGIEFQGRKTKERDNFRLSKREKGMRKNMYLKMKDLKSEGRNLLIGK